jgi:hypothetical protein
MQSYRLWQASFGPTQSVDSGSTVILRRLPNAVGMMCGGAPKAPTQSPAVIAGLRRIATSLWLRFVASPQRMPIFRYRRWGQSVVNVIYRVPPRRRFLQHRQYLVATNSGSTRLHCVLHAIPDTTRDVAPTRADLRIAPLAFPAYADPERVASGSASTLPGSSGLIRAERHG